MRFHFVRASVDGIVTCSTCRRVLTETKALAHAETHAARGDQPQPANTDLDNVTIIEVNG